MRGSKDLRQLLVIFPSPNFLKRKPRPGLWSSTLTSPWWDHQIYGKPSWKTDIAISLSSSMVWGLHVQQVRLGYAVATNDSKISAL